MADKRVKLVDYPQKAGASALRAKHYADGMLASEYVAAVAADRKLLRKYDAAYLRSKARADLRWDAAHGFIKLVASRRKK